MGKRMRRRRRRKRERILFVVSFLCFLDFFEVLMSVLLI